MLLSDFIEARCEKRIAAAREAAKTEGEARAYRKFAEWERRRKEAEDRGESSQNPRQHNRRRIQKYKGITKGVVSQIGRPETFKEIHRGIYERKLGKG